MSRPGRKRKFGPREPNGQLQRPTVDRLNQLAAEQRMKEQIVVLNQPHRRGNDHKWAESPLGRLGLRLRLHESLVEAGNTYASSVGRWRNCWGAPRGVGTPPTAKGSGQGPTLQAADRMRKDIVRFDKAMMKAGGINAVIAVKQLVLTIADTAPEQDYAAQVGLNALAVEMGKVDAKQHPFA